MTTPAAKHVAVKEGLEARKAGNPRVNPYAGKDGKPIPMLRAFHDAWFKGYDAGTRGE